MEISQDDPEKVLADILERYSYDQATQDYIATLFHNTLEYRQWTEDLIIKYLQNWKFNRIARMDRLILSLAICEIHTIDSVPPKVSIAEAIEIAREYSTEDSPSFVNGILDSVYQEVMKNQKSQTE